MFQAGDILACYGTDSTSRLIRWMTSWFGTGPSHVGIVADHKTHGRVLFESTSLKAGACLYALRPVDGVQIHRPWDRIKQYVRAGGTVELWRLVWQKKLDTGDRFHLAQLVLGYLRREIRYDTGGAVLSGTKLISRLSFLPVNHHEVFCSQLLHELLETLDLVEPDNARRYNPARLLRKLYYDGTYRKIGTVNRDNIDELLSGRLLICENETNGEMHV